MEGSHWQGLDVDGKNEKRNIWMWLTSMIRFEDDANHSKP